MTPALYVLVVVPTTAVTVALFAKMARRLPTLRRLPRRLDHIVGALEDGRLSVNVRLLADEQEQRTVTGLLHQALLTVLAATAGVMALLLLGLPQGPAVTAAVSLYEVLGAFLLIVCGVLALRVLIVIFIDQRP